MNRIIVGRNGYGKTTKVMELIKRDIENGHDNIIVIVPDQFTFETEQALIKLSGNTGILNISVLSFRNLIKKLRSQVGPLNVLELTDSSKAMFISKLALDYNDELKLYKDRYKDSSFCVSLSKIITECKQFNVDYDELKAIKKDKYQDISLLYSAYSNFKKDYLDNEDIINIVNTRLENSTLIQNANIYIEHFDVFTYQGYETIKQISKVANSLTISICADQNDDYLFSITNETVKKLQNILPECKTEILSSPTTITSFSILEKNLFSTKLQTTLTNMDNISLFGYSDILSEVDGAIESIIKLNNQGFSLCEMAVVTTDLQKYSPVLSQALDEKNIPYFIDDKMPLTHNRICKFLLYAIKCCNSKSALNILSLLKQDVIDIEPTEVFYFENYMKENGLKSTLKSSDEKIIDIFSKLRLNELDVKNIWQYIELFNIKFIDKTDKQAYEKLQEIISSAYSILENIDAKSFYDIVLTGASSIKISTIPLNSNSIVVGDISRTRLPSIKCLIVLGASYGNLPKVTTKDGLITFYESTNLQKHGIKIGRDTKDLNALEKILTYKMLTLPSNYLIISFSARDIDGSELKPSLIYDTITNIFSIDKNKVFKPYSRISFEKPNSPILNIGQDNANVLYNSNRFSVSKIEKYYSCPFAFLMTYGIGAKELKEYEVNSLNIGILYHDIFEKFAKQYENQKWIMEDKQIEQIVDDVVNNLITNDTKNTYQVFNDDVISLTMLKRITFYSKKLLKNIKKDLDENNFLIYQTEKNIKQQINIDDKKFVFEGKIDRVDTQSNDDYTLLNIIDYKSGSSEIDYKHIYNGSKIQLLVYMDALLKENASYVPNEISYLSIYPTLTIAKSPLENNNKLHSNSLNIKDIEKSIDKNNINIDDKTAFKSIASFGFEKLSDAITNIYKGDACAAPFDNTCEYCSFSTICKSQNIYKAPTLSKDKFISNILQNSMKEEDE